MRLAALRGALGRREAWYNVDVLRDAVSARSAMPIYHSYAPFYDGSGQFRFAVLMGHYLSELLAHHPVIGRRALDLACGTGSLALMLADAGWEVVGLDMAKPMLACARAKAENADLSGRVTFVHGDMRSLEPRTGTRRVNQEPGENFSVLGSRF